LSVHPAFQAAFPSLGLPCFLSVHMPILSTWVLRWLKEARSIHMPIPPTRARVRVQKEGSEASQMLALLALGEIGRSTDLGANADLQEAIAGDPRASP
jgi:hypothetical protein